MRRRDFIKAMGSLAAVRPVGAKAQQPLMPAIGYLSLQPIATRSNYLAAFRSGGDPTRLGLVSSFNRPNGNLTGLYFLPTELVAKRLALMHELLPNARRVAVLVKSSQCGGS
jgi:ABC-type uncharacterized transport system substrate-binding protein